MASRSSRRDSRQATETLHEIESVFDRGASLVAENPVVVLSVVAVVLLAAAGIGLWASLAKNRAESAAAVVAKVQADYLAAMGASPGAVFVEEPANPELARDARETHAARFLEAASEHDGTAAAAQARLQAGVLLYELGDLEGALAAWRVGANKAPGGELRALILMRLAGALEERGDVADAAQAWEEAGDIDQPAAALALAQAARCWADSGDIPRAIAVFERAEARAEGLSGVPPHLSARLRELRLRQRAGAEG